MSEVPASAGEIDGHGELGEGVRARGGEDPAGARPQVPTVPGNQLHPDRVLAHVVTAARSSRHIMRTPTTAQDSA